MDLGPWLLVGAIFGARVFYVVSYWDESFLGKPWYEMFMVQHGGLVYYGGLVGASLACIIFSRIQKLPLWRIADVLAPSVALGSFFGRWGCLMNGCCYGTETDLPWAIHFPPGTEAGRETGGVGVHPTEIYDSLLNFALYAFLAWVYRKRLFDGFVFGTYLMLYAICRSFVEIFRGDYPPGHGMSDLTPAQMVSVWIFIAGVALMLKQWGTARPPPPPPPGEFPPPPAQSPTADKPPVPDRA